MTKFEQIDPDGQREIINDHSEQSGFSPKIVEKDYWVCFVLAKLFEMRASHPMAFKGGTSLSKAFDLIDRFSEDIDITLDYKTFAEQLQFEHDPFANQTSGRKRKLISDQLKAQVSHYICDRIRPYFIGIIAADLPSNRQFKVEQDGDEILRFNYHSIFGDNQSSYLEESVVLEFGGRNFIVPNQKKQILPLLNGSKAKVEFIRANVEVLDPVKTFWEKATLAHDLCNKCLNDRDPRTHRMSRHWYDLFQMLNRGYEVLAEESLELLESVVELKSVFFRSAVSNYHECLEGKLRLIPDEKCLQKLKKDYKEMKMAEMFHGEEPEFEEIVSKLQSFQDSFNANQSP